MSRSRTLCGKCGRPFVEGGAVILVGPAGSEPTAPASLCDDCRDKILEWLGPKAFRDPKQAPRKAVVDHRRFETR